MNPLIALAAASWRRDSAGDITAPSVPAGLAASAVEATQFTLSWSPSTDDSGVIAEYEVFRNGASLGTVAGATTSLPVTGLSPQSTHQMTVRARDAAGNWSAQSAALGVTTAADTTAPSVPTGLASSNVAATSFTLSWAASTDNVGVTGYEVFRDGVSIGLPSGTSFSVTGLSPSTAYSMTVRARDAAGNWSAQSAAHSVTTAADTTAPSVPTGLASSNVAATSFTLSWTASTDNVGVTGYEVFRDGVSIGTPSSTSFSVTGLTESTTYSMRVRARDAAGNWSAQSTALSVTTESGADTQAPSVPTGLASSNVAATSFTLTWTASTDNVGVTGYEVFRDGVSIGLPSSTSFSVTGLSPSTAYSMTVRARDAAGNWSAQSAALSVTTAADTTAPSVPTGLASSNVAATSFTLSWTASTDNVGVTGYEVFRDGVSIGLPSGTSLAVTGLSPSTAYSMTVRARDAAGNWSAQSTALSVTTAADTTAPSVPTGLASSNVAATSFTLSWTASTDNVGVTGYEVFRDGVSIGTPSSTSLAVTGLTGNTTYGMTVRARDAAGNWSAQSAALNVTTAIQEHSVSAPDINAVAGLGQTAQGSSTATVSDGVGPFAHSWTWVSGGAGITLSGTTTPTVTAARTSTSAGTSSGVLRDSVTDQGNGNLVKTVDIQVALENSG